MHFVCVSNRIIAGSIKCTNGKILIDSSGHNVDLKTILLFSKGMEISEHQFPNLDTRIKKRFKKGEEVVVEVQRGRKHFKGSVSKN